MKGLASETAAALAEHTRRVATNKALEAIADICGTGAWLLSASAVLAALVLPAPMLMAASEEIMDLFDARALVARGKGAA